MKKHKWNWFEKLFVSKADRDSVNKSLEVKKLNTQNKELEKQVDKLINRLEMSGNNNKELLKNSEQLAQENNYLKKARDKWFEEKKEIAQFVVDRCSSGVVISNRSCVHDVEEFYGEEDIESSTSTDFEEDCPGLKNSDSSD